MTETKDTLRLEDLPEQIREPLKPFVEKLCSELGDKLHSITVVGSSLTQDYRPGQSDINTVVVLNEQTLGILNTIAGMAKSMHKRGISAPLLMTGRYIERSLDVFGIELLDFQLTHRTILGADPFAELIFDKKDVRLQCERELKATLIRLRQGYIAAAGKKKLVCDILIAAEKGLAPLLRAMLWLKNVDRPNHTEPTLRKAAGEFSVNVDTLNEVHRWKQERVSLSQTELQDVFESVYKIVAQLADVIDTFEV